MKQLRMVVIIIIAVSVGLLVSAASSTVNAWECDGVYPGGDQPPDTCGDYPEYLTNPCRAACGEYDDQDYTATNHPWCANDGYGGSCYWNYNYHGCCTQCEPWQCGGGTPPPTPGPGSPTNPPNSPTPTSPPVSPCPGGNPTCTSFTGFYLEGGNGSCTPASSWTSVPRSQSCITQTGRQVTEHRVPGGGADLVATQEIWDINTLCADVTWGWGAPMPLTSTETRILWQGAGEHKICARYECSTSGAAVQCGGMIELKKYCSVAPAGTTTIPFNSQTNYTLSGIGHEATPEEVNMYFADAPSDAQSLIWPIGSEPAGVFRVDCNPPSCDPARHFYRFAQTTTSNSSLSTTTVQTPLIPSGTYDIHCNVPLSPEACSGNPICTYEGGTYDCGSTWQSCSNQDNATLVVSTPTPTPTAAARARARILPNVPAACADITGTDWRDTTFTLSGESNRTSNGSSYATWNPLSSLGSKTLGPESVTDYTTYYCRTNNASLNPGLTYNYGSGDSIYWEIGYAPPEEWIQTRGGDVYGNSGVTSQLPQSLTYRYFSLNGHQPYPGYADSGLVITGNGTYDFTIEAGSGAAQVSAQGWLATDALPTSDFYQHLYLRLGAPTTPTAVALTGNFDCGATDICYFTTPQTVSSAISLTGGNKQIVLVNGNLSINSTVEVCATCFLAFIVSGNITVGSGVGHIPPISSTGTNPPADASDDIDGIYVANGNFTVDSNGTGDLQLVGHGSFVANSFIFNRDFRPANAIYSATNPVELFIYNPRLLFTMPQIMQDIPVRWEEVPPTQ